MDERDIVSKSDGGLTEQGGEMRLGGMSNSVRNEIEVAGAGREAPVHAPSVDGTAHGHGVLNVVDDNHDPEDPGDYPDEPDDGDGDVADESRAGRSSSKDRFKFLPTGPRRSFIFCDSERVKAKK